MSLRKVLKEITVGVFGQEQHDLRRNTIRAASALFSAYAEGQAEMFRNASIPVKYLALSEAPGCFRVDDAAVVDKLRSCVSSSLSGQAAVYNGLRIGVTVERLATNQRLLQLLNARMDPDGNIEIHRAEYVLAGKEECIILPTASTEWWANALLA